MNKLLIPSSADFGLLGISPLTLRFQDSKEEQNFQNDTIQSSIKNIRFCLIFAMFLIAAYTPFDFIILEQEDVPKALLARYIFIFGGAVALFMLSYIVEFRNIPIAGMLCVFWLSIGWPIFIFETNPETVIYDFPGLIMTFGYSFFLVGQFFVHAIISTLVMLILYSIVLWHTLDNFWLNFTTNTSLFCIYCILGLACYQKELSLRQNFVLSNNEKRRLSEANKQAQNTINWHSNLGRVLRHETSTQISAIQTSAEIIQSVRGVDIKEVSDQIIKSASQLNARISNMISANDLAEFIAKSKMESVEITDFCRSIINKYTPTFEEEIVEMRCRAVVIKKIHRDILEQALLNIINNGISFANPNTPVQVLVEERVGFLKFIVQNQGEQIDGSPDALFTPFLSSRSVDDEEHMGFGLYFAKMVAEKHQGSITIRNMADGSGVEVTMEISV